LDALAPLHTASENACFEYDRRCECLTETAFGVVAKCMYPAI
jgi:hypothetical protein